MDRGGRRRSRPDQRLDLGERCLDTRLARARHRAGGEVQTRDRLFRLVDRTAELPTCGRRVCRLLLQLCRGPRVHRRHRFQRLLAQLESRRARLRARATGSHRRRPLADRYVHQQRELGLHRARHIQDAGVPCPPAHRHREQEWQSAAELRPAFRWNDSRRGARDSARNGRMAQGERRGNLCHHSVEDRSAKARRK